MSDQTLLRKFQPCLRYDSLETYFADSAEEWTLNPGNVLRAPPAQPPADRVRLLATATAGRAVHLVRPALRGGS